jgi:peptidyl-prolyl cis-trans isomerase D
MRKYKQSIIIKFVFGIIVLSFIGTIFLVWGRGEKGLAGSDFAAKVNGMKISLDDYQKSYYRIRNMYEQIFGKSLTPEMEKQMGIKKLALDSLIDNAVVRKEADRMGITVTKDEIAKEIAGIPAFQKDGAFDFQQYQQTLKASRITPQNFEESVKEDLLVKKAQQKIQEKASVGDEEALQLFKKQHDKVELQFASFAPADVKGEAKVTEQDLNSYLQSHQEQFKTPEQISLSYLVVDPATVAAKITVSDDEAQTYYQKNIDRYQGKGGILPFAEVKERAKADALKAKAAKEAYEMAADALNKNLGSGNIDAAAAALGVRVNSTPFFTSSAPAAQLAGETEVIKRAFTLKQELGGPVETSRGIYLLKIKERKPTAVPPLAQIKGRVEALASEEKARSLAQKRAVDTVATLAGGKSDLKLQDTGSFAYSAKGEIPKIGVSREMMEAAFALSTAAPVAKTPFQTGERWYVIKLKARTEVDKDKFPTAKEEIKKTILPQKRQEVLASWMKELKGKAKIEINPGILTD